MATVIAVPNVIFCIFPLIIKSQGTAYLTVDYISIGVFFLLGCVYAAIGMFLSSLTESQIIAFISTFGILLVLYLWEGHPLHAAKFCDQRTRRCSDRF